MPTDNSARRHIVWLLEDNPMEVDMARRVLCEQMDIKVFGDGATLIERLAGGPPPPNALLLDWRLPGISGIEVCRYVREHYHKLAMPILMLTAYGSKADLMEGLAAGANDYLTKPYDSNELRARVMTLVENSRAYHHIKYLEQETMAQADELRSRMDFEQQLIGIVSHDLRNPVAAIKMLVEQMVRRDTLTPKQQLSMGRIGHATGRLQRMLDDLMDFTQARLKGGVVIARTPGDFHEIANHAVEEMRAAYPERGVDMVVEGTGAGAFDGDRLAQVFGNLLSNAMKYGAPTARVQVSVREEEAHMAFAVHNTGQPIPPDVLPHIFEPLQRGSQTVAAGGRSIGLGLYIVRQIVQAHGGAVDVASSLEQGTTFTVRVPRDEP